MNADIQWACNELIGALIEGGAQGALITGFIWGVLKLCPRANAATRHAAWFATLLIVALLPIAHFGRAVAAKFAPNEARTNVPSPSVSIVPAARAEALAGQARALPIEASSIGEFTVDTPALRLPEESPIQVALASVELSPQTSREVAVAPQTNPTPALRWSLPVSPKLALVVAICWVILAAIRLGGIAGQLAALRSMKLRAVRATDSFVYAFARVVANMRIGRKPRLLISDQAPAPMAVGFFQPAMLLPQSIAERSTSSQLEHLFRHELAHLARRDDWTNLIQQAIAAVFFFHPSVLFLSRRLTAEREIACDDHALAIGRAPREYALFLTEFASQMKGRDFTAAPAAWSSNSQLKERIGMILNGKRNASPRVSRAGAGAITATAIALAIAAALATPRFVVAAESSASASPAKTPKAATTVSVDTSVEPAVEVSVDVAPVAGVAANVAPVEVAVPAIPVAPSAPSAGVTIASIAPAPPSRDMLPSLPARPKAVIVAPNGARIAMTPQPDGDEPRPHPKHIERDGDVEKRLDRLEKMVEELMAREKRGPRGPDNFQFPQNNFNPNFNSDQLKMEIDRAQRDAERARRDAERAMREQKIAMEKMSMDKQHAEQQELTAKIAQDVATAQAGRESLKARRHALEAQRKAIEKELQALEKEMQKQDEMREKQHIEKDKHNRSDDAPEKPERPEKLEKKSRDRGGDSDDDNPKRP